MPSKLKLRQLHVKVGLCSVTAIPLDFKRNYRLIMQSIQECLDLGCSIRIGSELEVSGYGCDDHFAEYDTIYHSWDIIRDIIKSGITQNIVCELGTPLLHKAALYDARVIIYQSKIVAIRVKTIAADGDIFNETRTFATWKQKRGVGEYRLPEVIQEVTGQVTVPIGVFIINYKDTLLAYEICEEAQISNNPMIDAALDGAEIFVNSSAVQVTRGKLRKKIQMIQELTERHGGAYIYVNSKGRFERQYFEGGNIVSQNGKLIYLSELHRLEDVCVTPAILNLNKIRSFRLSNKSFQKESHGISKIPRVHIDKYIATNDEEYTVDSPQHIARISALRAVYEFPHATYEPSLYLWQTLKSSRASGYHISLSGGKNSASVALIVYNMCCVVYKHIVENGYEHTILKDLRKIIKNPAYYPTSPKDICSKLLYTTYMQTENSTEQTRQRASAIAQQINANHNIINFENVYLAFKNVGKNFLGKDLKFLEEGGSETQDKALSQCQARTRMALSYYISQLALAKEKREGFLIKLASLNLDYLLRGLFSKYDCSSADYNPIGSFTSERIREFLEWNQTVHGFKFISDVLTERQTHELKPFIEGVSQNIEDELELTHDELSLFAELRRVNKLGPVKMFDHIYCTRNYTTINELAEKVKKFFILYSKNRHKMPSMTPIYHFNPEGCDDSRLDQRPIIYATDWSYQFQILDERVKELHKGKGLGRKLSLNKDRARLNSNNSNKQ